MDGARPRASAVGAARAQRLGQREACAPVAGSGRPVGHSPRPGPVRIPRRPRRAAELGRGGLLAPTCAVATRAQAVWHRQSTLGLCSHTSAAALPPAPREGDRPEPAEPAEEKAAPLTYNQLPVRSCRWDSSRQGTSIPLEAQGAVPTELAAGEGAFRSRTWSVCRNGVQGSLKPLSWTSICWILNLNSGLAWRPGWERDSPEPTGKGSLVGEAHPHRGHTFHLRTS